MNILRVYVITSQSLLYLEMEQCKLYSWMEMHYQLILKTMDLSTFILFHLENPYKTEYVHEYSTQYKALSWT